MPNSSPVHALTSPAKAVPEYVCSQSQASQSQALADTQPEEPCCSQPQSDGEGATQVHLGQVSGLSEHPLQLVHGTLEANATATDMPKAAAASPLFSNKSTTSQTLRGPTVKSLVPESWHRHRAEDSDAHQEAQIHTQIAKMYASMPPEAMPARFRSLSCTAIGTPEGWARVTLGGVPSMASVEAHAMAKPDDVVLLTWSHSNKQWAKARIMGWENAGVRDPQWQDWGQICFTCNGVLCTKRMQLDSHGLALFTRSPLSTNPFPERYGQSMGPVFPMSPVRVPSPAISPQSRLHMTLQRKQQAARRISEAADRAVQDSAQQLKDHGADSNDFAKQPVRDKLLL